jgi:phosphoglycerol transferase MdoB-like AlkP superfamily enzyme
MHVNIDKSCKTFRPVFVLAIIFLIISLLTRVTLLFLSGEAAVSITEIIVSLAVGWLYDLTVAGFVLLPMLLYLTFINEYIYQRQRIKWVVLSGVILTIILLFSNLIPKDYNKDLYKAFVIFLLVRWIIYLALVLGGPVFRTRWRNGMTFAIFTITVFALFFNAVSEIFFWQEFSSRYNFIAVDYLVYTNEVLGNIQESYPLALIISVIMLVTIFVLFISRRKLIVPIRERAGFLVRALVLILFTFLTLIIARILPSEWQYFSTNNCANELAGNGIYDFVQAFKKNELDFFKYYRSLPEDEAFSILRGDLKVSNTRSINRDSRDVLRRINYDEAEKKMNVVLISVESLSASFLSTFGNKNNLTPFLDSLAEKGLLFTNLYAAGTRTVRGLEAISLSVPPLPGQSLVKRPDNKNLFSLGSVFRSKGYITQYIYGGYSYFDNMQDFFSGNGYQVVDRSALKKSEIHYSNIWGVADEDLFTLAIREMDSNYQAHRPFFSHVMTVSNHRPYTYPEGRIDIPASSQTRDGAVKYTDYAIGQFIRNASQKPWFSNTLFVIVADHCASSAGKTALPVTGYHIPMIMYAPGKIVPGKMTGLTSQLDIAPSVLGWLQFDYDSRFFGRDVFHDTTNARAFISTYQGLGFLSGDTLIVQSPKQQVKAYRIDRGTGEEQLISADSVLIKKAISFYQSAASLIRRKKYTSEGVRSP